MLDVNRRIHRQPLSEPVDVLLADIAIRIQLSQTDYGKAERRYKTLSDWIDRRESPLAGRVQLLYPQGSMAIGATIASRLTTDEFDVDVAAQLDLARDVEPKRALDLLFESIRGEAGSRYYGMTDRQTRCVTVHYAGKMHVDITPMVRLPERCERTSHLFHSKPEAPDEADKTLIANPWGFAERFKNRTLPDDDFARVFEARAAEYETLLLAEKADSEALPGQLPVHRKSKAVIVLQLLKRWRNVRYDQRCTRRPPSIMMAKLIADAANSMAMLSEELCHQACSMLAEFRRWQAAGLTIYVANPTCAEDILTDRWPASLQQQDMFIRDLEDLVVKLERLVAGCDLADMRAILGDLFGEAPAEQAIRALNERTGTTIRNGRSHYIPDGGRLSLPASGIVAPAVARPTPRHTFFGAERTHR